MSGNNLDVVAVGNAIVDVLAKADDAFLEKFSIPKGGMMLIDDQQASDIYEAMAPGVEMSGGSAANSIASIASLGGAGGFIGKVAKDALGDIFRHDLKAMGVEFDTKPLEAGPATARCLINVTDDAQRSMTTFLGAAGFVGPDDVDEALISRGAITFFEGYLFEQPMAREGFEKACAIAHQSGKRTALSLSDAGCVERQLAHLKACVPGNVDIVIANEDEAAMMYGSDNLDEIANRAREMAPLTAVTQGEKGSVIIPRDGDLVKIDAVPPAALVDTTGAGDAFAAGLLFALATNRDLEFAGKLGALTASEVISHFGARPEQPLDQLAKDHGLS